jgi:uncharacterized protein DUF6668
MWGRRTALQIGDRGGNDRLSNRHDAEIPNPWVTATTDTEPRKDEGVDDAPHALVPSLGPQPGVIPPPPQSLARVTMAAATARVWWVGVHGGAGESTLARLMEGSSAAGHAWPVPATSAGSARPSVVLVARTHASGLRAAQAAATEWAAGDVPVRLLGLVLVADAPGRTPRPLRDLARLVVGGVPSAWHVPWHEPWRLGDPIDAASAPAAVRELLDAIDELAPPSAPPGPRDDDAVAQGRPAADPPRKGVARA